MYVVVICWISELISKIWMLILGLVDACSRYLISLQKKNMLFLYVALILSSIIDGAHL